jgi:hypothetical protein
MKKLLSSNKKSRSNSNKKNKKSVKYNNMFGGVPIIDGNKAIINIDDIPQHLLSSFRYFFGEVKKNYDSRSTYQYGMNMILGNTYNISVITDSDIFITKRSGSGSGPGSDWSTPIDLEKKNTFRTFVYFLSDIILPSNYGPDDFDRILKTNKHNINILDSKVLPIAQQLYLNEKIDSIESNKSDINKEFDYNVTIGSNIIHNRIKIMKMKDHNLKFLIQYRNVGTKSEPEYIIRIIYGFNIQYFINKYINDYFNKQTDLNGNISNDILKIVFKNLPYINITDVILDKYRKSLFIKTITDSNITLEQFYNQYMSEINIWSFSRDIYFEKNYLDMLKTELNIPQNIDNLIFKNVI